MIPEEYLVVEARIDTEHDNLLTLERELHRYGLFPQISATTVGSFSLDDAASCRIIGSILHDYYGAVENVFKTVAARIDKSTPTGVPRHRELLEQMALTIPGLRPAVISKETAEKLDSYRAFRHVFRNVYGFHLAPARMKELLRELPETSEALRADLKRFSSEMRAACGLS